MTQTTSGGTRRPRLGARYWRLWWANAISSIGDGAFVAALPLLAVTMWNVVTVSLRQQVVPAPLLGRVNGVYRMLGWGLMPLGALAGGFVAHAAGLRAPYLVAGLLCGLCLLAAVPFLLGASRVVEARSRGRG
jgi:hypothetical protein